MSFNSRWVSQQYSSEGPRNPGEKDQQGKHRTQHPHPSDNNRVIIFMKNDPLNNGILMNKKFRKFCCKVEKDTGKQGEMILS